MLGSRVKGSPYIDSYDDTSEIGIRNVISISNHVNFIRSGMKVDSGKGNGY
jgi:hypothetical protein